MVYQEEFNIFWKLFDRRKIKPILKYYKGDVCDFLSEKTSIAHCISGDFRLGAGVARSINRRFCSKQFLLKNQRRGKVGEVISQKTDRGIIHHMVTKRRASDKPTYLSIWCCLKELRAKYDRENGPHSLAFPAIGCGLDQKTWRKVKFMISYVFRQKPNKPKYNIKILEL